MPGHSQYPLAGRCNQVCCHITIPSTISHSSLQVPFESTFCSSSRRATGKTLPLFCFRCAFLQHPAPTKNSILSAYNCVQNFTTNSQGLFNARQALGMNQFAGKASQLYMGMDEACSQGRDSALLRLGEAHCNITNTRQHHISNHRRKYSQSWAPNEGRREPSQAGRGRRGENKVEEGK